MTNLQNMLEDTWGSAEEEAAHKAIQHLYIERDWLQFPSDLIENNWKRDRC